MWKILLIIEYAERLLNPLYMRVGLLFVTHGFFSSSDIIGSSFFLKKIKKFGVSEENILDNKEEKPYLNWVNFFEISALSL